MGTLKGRPVKSQMVLYWYLIVRGHLRHAMEGKKKKKMTASFGRWLFLAVKWWWLRRWWRVCRSFQLCRSSTTISPGQHYGWSLWFLCPFPNGGPNKNNMQRKTINRWKIYHHCSCGQFDDDSLWLCRVFLLHSWLNRDSFIVMHSKTTRH